MKWFMFLYLAMTFSLMAENIIPTFESSFHGPLGSGYLTKEKIFVPPCVTGEIVYLGDQQGEIGVFSQTTSEAIKSQLSLHTTFGINFWIGSIEASLAVRIQAEDSSYKHTEVYNINFEGESVALSNIRLNQRGKEILARGLGPEV